MKFKAIPSPIGDQIAFNKAIKENLEAMAGLRGGRINELESTATTADIISKINELIARVSA